MKEEEIATALDVLQVCSKALMAAPSGIPSGQLYASLMPTGITLDGYNGLIGLLKRAGLAKERNHLITWCGPVITE